MSTLDVALDFEKLSGSIRRQRRLFTPDHMKEAITDSTAPIYARLGMLKTMVNTLSTIMRPNLDRAKLVGLKDNQLRIAFSKSLNPGNLLQMSYSLYHHYVLTQSLLFQLRKMTMVLVTPLHRQTHLFQVNLKTSITPLSHHSQHRQPSQINLGMKLLRMVAISLHPSP